MKLILTAAGLLLASTTASACFLSGEDADGMNRICYYQCASGRKAITVPISRMCPISLSQAPGAPVVSKLPAPLQLALARK